MRHDDVTERLGEIGVLTLVVVGDQDVDPGVVASTALAARIPGAEFATLPDTGHWSPSRSPTPSAGCCCGFLGALPPPGD